MDKLCSDLYLYLQPDSLKIERSLFQFVFDRQAGGKEPM